MARSDAVAAAAPATAREDGPRQPELFSGPFSLRARGEQSALRLCILMAPVTIGLIGLIFKSVTLSDIILLIVAGMVYVSLSRGRLLGSSIRIHERQLPELHAIVDAAAKRLGLEPPQIFVRDDPFVPIAAVGIGEPYALMLSSQYLEHLRPNELRFLVARELAHIAAGHTRFMSLLSVSGRENPAVALIFGAWLRRAEYTADRVGLLCCESVADAVVAISITTFHAIGRRVDVAQLAAQEREIAAEPTLRMGEWTSGTPYAVNRIAQLEAFTASPLAEYWRRELTKPRTAPPVIAELPADAHVDRHDCAPVWRRALAFGIDFVIVGIILQSIIGATAGTGEAHEAARKAVGNTEIAEFFRFLAAHGISLTYSGESTTTVLGLFVYSVILVALSGQTLGMMVAESRVVTTDFVQAGIGRTIFRYIVATFDLIVLPIALFGLIFRVQPHDRISGTRVVRSRAPARTAAASVALAR